MKMPVKARSWLEYPFWVDWVGPDWLDPGLKRSDWASRPFEQRKDAIDFATALEETGSAIVLYERGTASDGSSDSLFIFHQINAEDEFHDGDDLTKIKSGFGYRWTDGRTSRTPEKYKPLRGA
ncbi:MULTISPECIES: hypothetical protein [unclassified Roseovarius]|uniref:hypothetical protein n=1 Tax=unclassified Roseovarius TaxID=2614913 RepID=UPI00273D7344|nr:hypothetical protein [Roseovarius sp. MMSF_3350]